MIKIYFIALIAIIQFNNCIAQKIAGNYGYETECMGVEQDGTQTLKAWGYGKNRADAVEQAKKNAVRDVLFSGIRNGNGGCNVKPLIFEINARETHEDYFNRFFADGGAFEEYVDQKDASLSQRIRKDKKKASTGVEFGVIVRVLRVELKQRMIRDKIINQ